MNRRHLLLGATAAVVAPVLPLSYPCQVTFTMDFAASLSPTWQQVYDAIAIEVSKIFGVECLGPGTAMHEYACALTNMVLHNDAAARAEIG